jgi:hypothetical protein
MNLTAKIHTSWELMQSSLRVLRAQPRLALFPIVSTLCAVVLALFFFAPIVVLLAEQGWTTATADEIRDLGKPVFYTYGAVIYLVSLFVATYFNTAFYHEILRALAGEDVSVAGGLRFANGKLKSILLWSLLAGTVGLIIRAIEERMDWLGKIVLAAVGTAWSVAAVFAIPVLIRREDGNPLAVLRDSAVTLKRTWGESLVGFVGINLAGLVLAFAAAALAVAILLFAAFGHGGWFAVFLGVVWLIVVVGLSYGIHLATHVYRCALYVYASEGVVPGPFTAEMMNAGWKIKTR